MEAAALAGEPVDPEFSRLALQLAKAACELSAQEEAENASS